MSQELAETRLQSNCYVGLMYNYAQAQKKHTTLATACVTDML